MDRTTINLNKDLVARIDEGCKETGTSRNEYLVNILDNLVFKSEYEDKLKTILANHNECFRELKEVRRENGILRSELETARYSSGEYDLLQAEYTNIFEELAQLRHDYDILAEVNKGQRGEISYLRSHIANLTSRIPQLPAPAEEEKQHKPRWKFWR